MAVGRGAARLAAVFMVLAGVVAAAATPAAAEDQDRVGVRAPGSFTVGGSAGGVNVSVIKRTKGCVIVRTALGIELAGLTAEQVRVEVAVGGQWQPVGVSGAGGGVATGPTQPENPVLCGKRSITVRYRVAFLAGAPAGTATLIGQAGGAAGQLIGRGSDTSQVLAGRAALTPSATASPSESVSSEPTEEPPTAAQTTGTPPAAVGATSSSDGGGLGFGWMVVLLGVGMVGLGVALLVLLLRRNRAGAEGAAAGVPGPAGPFPAAAGGFPAHTQAFPAHTQAFPAQTQGYPDHTQAFPAQDGSFPPATPFGDQTEIMPRFPQQP